MGKILFVNSMIDPIRMYVSKLVKEASQQDLQILPNTGNPAEILALARGSLGEALRDDSYRGAVIAHYGLIRLWGHQAITHLASDFGQDARFQSGPILYPSLVKREDMESDKIWKTGLDKLVDLYAQVKPLPPLLVLAHDNVKQIEDYAKGQGQRAVFEAVQRFFSYSFSGLLLMQENSTVRLFFAPARQE